MVIKTKEIGKIKSSYCVITIHKNTYITRTRTLTHTYTYNLRLTTVIEFTKNQTFILRMCIRENSNLEK